MEEEWKDEMMIEFRRVKSPESDSADKLRRCTRRIIAEDPSWTLTIVSSLVDICIRHIADNFCCKSSPLKFAEKINVYK